jgi:aspartyl-tRNA(Asn)/glutamyl-tRNA(Gln) amidotransferase subunit A
MTVDDWLRQALQAAEGRRIEGLPALLETLAVSTRALRAADWNLPADQTLTSAGIDPGAGPRPAPSPRSDAVSEPPAARRTGAAEPRLRSIAQLALALRTGALSSGVLTEACLAAIEVRNPDLNAFITVTASLAREQARRADQELAGGRDRGPLHGIPISLKDLVDLEGYPTTAASRVRAGLVATRDATVSARLKAAGAVIVGKCNLHEFAFGTTNEDSAYGPARHPIFPDRSPGGSSGGSAAAVAAGLCAASVGTDTGGSIRIPAAACGIVGFKPPFGAVPVDGVVPLGRTLDHVGPLARTAGDAWWMYLAMLGRLDRDRAPLPAVAVAGHTLGLLQPYVMDHLDTEVRRVFNEALARLRDAGAISGEVSLPHAPLTAPVYLHTVLAEAAAYHATTLEARGTDYTPAVRVRLEMARFVLGEDYVRAQHGRELLRHEVDSALAGCDALVLPALPITAPVIGATTVDLDGTPDSVRNATLRLTQLFDLTGHPAVTIPCGLSREGLPVGLQLVGRHDGSESLLALAGACEDVLGRAGASR